MILASTFGSFGVAIGLLMSLTYVASLKSFGVNYLKPISTDSVDDWKDSIIRAPLLNLITRPAMLDPQDPIRKKKKKRRDSDDN